MQCRILLCSIYSMVVIGFLTLTTTLPTSSASLRIRNNTVRRFFIRLQPELDVVDIDAFVRNDHLLKFQLKCLLNNDSYCDPIGRWLAPRLPFMLLRGHCPKCTEIQRNKIAIGLNYIRREKPNIYQALLERYIVQDDGEDKDTESKPDSVTPTNQLNEDDKDFESTTTIDDLIMEEAKLNDNYDSNSENLQITTG